MKVACIGECMIEFSAARDGLFARGFGGDTLNTAVYLSRLGIDTAYVTALDVMRPGGVIVQLGLGGEMTLPINTIVAKELQLRGTFRFDREFELAVRLMGEGLIDVKPLISASLPFDNAIAAFELASDRSKSMKVQLTF